MLQYFWFVWKKHGACVAFSYPSDEDFQFYSTYSMRTVEGHWFVQHRNIDWTGENIRVNIDLSPITWGAGVNVSRDRKLMDGWQSIRLAKYNEREDWRIWGEMCAVYGVYLGMERTFSIGELCFVDPYSLSFFELNWHFDGFWFFVRLKSTISEKKRHTQ